VSDRVRVGLDATSWLDRRGYGRFARNVLSRLVERDGESEYVLLVDERTAAADLPPAAVERRVVRMRRPLAGDDAAGGRSLRDVLELRREVGRAGLDVVVFPSLLTYVPVRGASVVGIHDATPSELDELTMPARADRLKWRLKERSAVRSATRLFTVSEASRAKLRAVFGIDESRVSVVPEAPDPVFSPRPQEEVDRATAWVGLQQGTRYLVYAAGVSPHKSVETLIDALARVPEVRLVLCGSLEGGAYPSSAPAVRERIAAHGLRDRVLLPGFVPDDALAGLYSGAAAAVVTSLAEGFGLPAVEAAACATPTVLSDLPAHRESLGDAALRFPPGDAAALAAQLERLLADAELAAAIGEEGRRHVSRLTWDVSADRLRAVIGEAAT
jgi:glycosyltransferase involved in cell wall biosynthesis